jgi:hypothetical protein
VTDVALIEGVQLSIILGLKSKRREEKEARSQFTVVVELV